MPVSSATEASHLCYTRASWGDSWDERPLLECISIADQAAPGHSSGRFEHRYGQARLPAIGSRPADSSPATIARGSLIGLYVKVELSNGIKWFGILTDTEDDRSGELTGAVPSGMEQYTAFGLTLLLEKSQPITQSRIKTSGGTAVINQGMVFNAGSDGRMGRSRVAGKNYDSASKSFADRVLVTSPDAWKAKDAVDYLFDAFPLKDKDGSEVLTVNLFNDSALDYILSAIPTHGKTRWQILNELVDRKRGLGFRTTMSATEELEIRFYTSNESAISLPGGWTIPANGDQVTLDFDAYVNVGRAVVSTSALLVYDQVEVIGERVGAVFTVSPDASTGNMVPDWETADETAYNDAATGETGYGDLTDTEKAAANADYRARDEFAPVFSWWRLKEDWDGKQYNETGSNEIAFVDFYDDGGADVGAVNDFWIDGLRVQSIVPLRPGVDYTGTIDPDVDDSDDRQRDYLAPIVLLQCDEINDNVSSDDEGWVHCERLDAASTSGDPKREFEWSVQVRVRDDVPGLMLEVVGAQQHFIADDLFSSQGAFEDLPANETIASDKWLATVYVLQNEFCRGVYPLNANVAAGDVKRVLTLRFPDAHLDWIPSGTVVGVEAGALQVTSQSGWLRDDRDNCKDIARLAFEWYGTERRTLDLSFRQISPAFQVGQLITQIGSGANVEAINTVISSVTYNLRSGVTNLKTSFAEFDAVGVST